MSMAAPVNQSARVRQLAAQHPYLSPADIAETSGLPLKLVKAALGRRDLRVKPKSRVRVVEARGPLTAGEVAERVRIPLASAKLVTR